MSSDIKRKNKNKQQVAINDELKLSKEEEKIAKYLRFNCPNKKANLAGMKVDFFNGSKAVDCLMESKWAPNLFSNRQLAINFMKKLLTNELFHRAVKIYKEETSSSTRETNESGVEGTPKVKKRKNQDKSSSSQDLSTAKKDDSTTKRKFKLEVHEEQKFVDAPEPYVWIYEPTTMTSMLIGSLLVIGAIGICMFPLWPSSVRQGVYYLSIGGASFLGVLLGLAGFKYILFSFLWLCTLGRIEFWLLPNLTEDVGFFESFVPLYKLKINDTNSKDDKTKDTKRVNTSEERQNVDETSNLKDINENQSTNMTSNEPVDMEIVDGNDDEEDFELLDSGDIINESAN